MNVKGMILALTLSVGGFAYADDHNHESRKEHREELKKDFLDKRCKGDKACEADLKQKFEEKKAEKKAEIDQKCGQDEACRKAERQKIIQNLKEKRDERKQNAADEKGITSSTTTP